MKSTKVQTLGVVMRHTFRHANRSHGSVNRLNIIIVHACQVSYNNYYIIDRESLKCRTLNGVKYA